jgi:hypothetical protein
MAVAATSATKVSSSCAESEIDRALSDDSFTSLRREAGVGGAGDCSDPWAAGAERYAVAVCLVRYQATVLARPSSNVALGS